MTHVSRTVDLREEIDRAIHGGMKFWLVRLDLITAVNESSISQGPGIENPGGSAFG